MKEKEKSSRAEWNFYGSDFGGKVDGLLAFEKEGVTDVEVVPGEAIGASFFREFVRQNQFSDKTPAHDVYHVEKLPTELEKTNRQILSDFLPGTCLAIRSSTVGENRGVGVYSTFFMVTSVDIETDLEALTKFELLIYADYFGANSRDFLADKFLSPNGGVGLLVQKVIGDQHGEFFMPAISGVATAINGELTLRLVIGLGTKAVEMKDAIVIKRNNLRPEVIKNALFSLRQAEAIGLTEGKVFLTDLEAKGNVFLIDIEREGKKKIIQEVDKLTALIESWQKLDNLGKPYYWEFAVTGASEHPQILQANREEPFDERATELGPITGRVIAESNDVVNVDTKTGRGIVHLNLSGVTLEDLKHLHLFNQTNRDYLLIIDDILFSQSLRRGGGLGLGHFSNAAGVIERQRVRDNRILYQLDQINHVDRGGTHFIEICKRNDILFQGVVTPPWDETLEEALGPFSERFGQFGAYWAIEYKMTNTKDEGRVEVYGEVFKREYSREKLHRWIDELKIVAEILEPEDKVASDAFYNFSYHLITAVGHSVADYDPYGFVDQLLPESLQELRIGFDLIFQSLYLTESYADYQEGLRYSVTEKEGNVFELREYLGKLKLRIEAKLSMPVLSRL